jgi:hypothetical protein
VKRQKKKDARRVEKGSPKTKGTVLCCCEGGKKLDKPVGHGHGDGMAMGGKESNQFDSG